MTEWAAEQYDEQDSKGTLEAGKLADLVILDKDPLKVDPMTLNDIRIVETIKEGTTIYPAPDDAETPKVAAANAGETYSWRAHVCDMADVNSAANKEWTLITPQRATVRESPSTLCYETRSTEKLPVD